MDNTKFTRVYKSAESTHTWYYDLERFKNGPVRVEVQYHDGLTEWEPGKKKKTKAAVKPKPKKAKAKPKTKQSKPTAKKANKKTAEWFDL